MVHQDLLSLKKLIAIAVLFAFLVNSMGYFVIFRCRQFLIREEMMAEIRRGGFHPGMVLLRVENPENNNQFSRLGRREFIYCGRLYDVVVERKSGDTSVFWCMRDKKEESLLADFSLYLKSTSHRTSSGRSNPIPALIQNLISKALVPSPSVPGIKQVITISYPDVRCHLTKVYLTRFAPPPELT